MLISDVSKRNDIEQDGQECGVWRIHKRRRSCLELFSFSSSFPMNSVETNHETFG